MLKNNRSNRNWNRSQRRRYQECEFDIQFDWNKPLNQCCYSIINSICSKDAFSNKNQLLIHLNLFIKYCLYRYGKLELTNEQKNDQNETFSDIDILCCIRMPFFHEAAEVRAASLRAIRYFVQNKQTLHVLLKLNLHHLIARSLDLVLDNRVERIQAMRLVRHFMAIDPNIFPMALGRCLCSLSNDSLLEKDMLLKVCWATIAELTIVNSLVSARSGCINVLTRCVLNSVTGLNSAENDDGKNRNKTNAGPSLVTTGMMTNVTVPFTNIAICEAILSSFMHLFNYPETRKLLQPNGTDLFYFIAPFTDLYSFYHASQAAKEQKKLGVFHLADHLAGNDRMQFDKEHKLLPHPPIYKNNQQQQQQTLSLNFEQDRILRYIACKNAILSILRSWPGLLFMCRVSKLKTNQRLNVTTNLWDNSDMILPRKLIQNFKKADDDYQCLKCDIDTLNPLESLVMMLYLPYNEIHRHLIELFYELFGLRFPEWIENFDEALKNFYFNYTFKISSKLCSANSSKNYFPDEWQLYDGFIAREAEDIFPNKSSSRLNLITNYHALLLQSLVEFGILDALISLILDSHDKAAVNLATILTGELIHLSGKYLPPSEYAHRCQSFPTLVAASISGSRERRNRALMTISNFKQIHYIKKLGPRPASLFLEQQIYFCGSNIENRLKTNARSASISKMQDENVISSVKNSGVLRKSCWKDWNWDTIADLLKQPYEMMRKLEDKDVRAFTSRLLEFYCPSKRQFSSISKNSGLGSSSEATTPTTSSPSGRYEVLYFDNPILICRVATFYIDFLLQADEQKASEYVEEFIHDLERCLKNVATKSPSTDEILIPSRLLSTLSHYYFLLLGRFTYFQNGRNLLKKTHINQYLIDLVNLSTNEVYTKLIVSSLNYNNEANFSRSILSKVLTSPIESSRVYATKFMRVLLRVGLSDFCKWALDLLIGQIYDSSSTVSSEALNILDEACTENVEYLEKIVQHRPALLNLGDHGIVFFTRFASHSFGINMLIETNILQNELNRWKTHFCYRYVRLVEDSMNECFSCHQKGITGKYGRRSDKRHYSQRQCSHMSSYLIHHLYGQLAQSYEGLQVIIQHSLLQEQLQIFETEIHRYLPSEDQNANEQCRPPTEIDVIRMKSALWCIGHLSSSELGIDYVLKCSQSLINWITLLIERSSILSLRATGFHIVCLMASTDKGAQILSQFGWTAIQHSHNDSFPIDQQEFQNFHPLPKYPIESFDFVSNHPKSIVSIPNGYFSLYNEDTSNHNQNQDCQFTIESSSSSSSSYSSILHSSGHFQQQRSNDKRINPLESKKINKDHLGALSSSSTISLNTNYSNNSSIGALLNAAANVNENSRIRSSSDCISTNVLTSTVANKLSDSKTSKPEYQDSGILDQSCDVISNKTLKDILSVERNRKISEPCFPLSSGINGKIRSDSNESGQTNQTNTESRSTSFTEYSTASSNSNNNIIDQQGKFERNVSFVDNKTPTQQNTKDRPKHTSLIERQAPLITIMQNNDPYPSPIDAYGYAQLRAIHKRRFQSLSGNMFFNYGNFSDSPYKSSDEQLSSSFDNQRKVSTSPINHLNVDYQKRRSFSGCSQISYQSEEILSENAPYSNQQNFVNKKSNFMCLCLPQSLSLIFFLDENRDQNAKKRVKFQNKQRKFQPTYFSEKHLIEKCIVCCIDHKYERKQDIALDNFEDLPIENSSNENEPKSNIDSKQRLEVLQLVYNLSAPLHAKQAEQGLLSFKQKYPDLFEDFCLYSDVCLLMENNNLKSSARRFLQELFLDINLDRFFNDTEAILKKYEIHHSAVEIQSKSA